MKQAHILVLTAAITFGATYSGWWFGQRSSQNLSVPPSAAAAAQELIGLRLPDSDGREQALAQWQGRWLLVNFWAPWCAPCREEMPLLDTAQQRWGSRGLQVIGLGIDEAASIARYRSTQAVQFPLLVAGAEAISLSSRFGNNAQALPFSVLISPSGEVKQLKSGPFKGRELDSLLESLLGPLQP